MNSTISQNDNFVMTPIPKHLYPLVIQTIATALETEKEGSDVQQATAPQQKTVKVAQPLDWKQVSTMKKLRAGLSIPIAITLMDMAAAAAINNAGDSVSFEAVYKQAGFAESQRARSSLGAFTKVIKREFGVPREQANWPVETEYGSIGDARYTMLPEVAKAWIQSAS